MIGYNFLSFQRHKCVKCTLVQTLRLCTGRTAHRGRKGIALLFLYHGTRRGEGSAPRPWQLFTPGKDPIPIVQEAGLTPGPVWTALPGPHLKGIVFFHLKLSSVYLNICNIDICNNPIYSVTRIITHYAPLNQDTTLHCKMGTFLRGGTSKNLLLFLLRWENLKSQSN